MILAKELTLKKEGGERHASTNYSKENRSQLYAKAIHKKKKKGTATASNSILVPIPSLSLSL
jgi:hypothetical protein